MPGAGTADLIEGLESLDLKFTGLWSQSVRLRCGTFFFNPDMPNDLFFDKFAGIGCIDGQTIDDTLALFKAHATRPYYYIRDRPDLEDVLLE